MRKSPAKSERVGIYASSNNEIFGRASEQSGCFFYADWGNAAQENFWKFALLVFLEMHQTLCIYVPCTLQ